MRHTNLVFTAMAVVAIASASEAQELQRLTIGGFINHTYQVEANHNIAFPVFNTPQRSYYAQICVVDGRDGNGNHTATVVRIKHGNTELNIDSSSNDESAQPRAKVCYDDVGTGGVTVVNDQATAMQFTIRITDRYVRPVQRAN